MLLRVIQRDVQSRSARLTPPSLVNNSDKVYRRRVGLTLLLVEDDDEGGASSDVNDKRLGGNCFSAPARRTRDVALSDIGRGTSVHDLRGGSAP